uniref:Uncharacterized protein n=1 Tax=Arundo donax TaxID=35708 RepID=A0A0A9DW15_ARUDO
MQWSMVRLERRGKVIDRSIVDPLRLLFSSQRTREILHRFFSGIVVFGSGGSVIFSSQRLRRPLSVVKADRLSRAALVVP